MLDGRTGYVVPPGDPDSLRERLQILIGDAALRESMGRGARELYEESFTFERMVSRTIDVYERLLGRELLLAEALQRSGSSTVPSRPSVAFDSLGSEDIEHPSPWTPSSLRIYRPEKSGALNVEAPPAPRPAARTNPWRATKACALRGPWNAAVFSSTAGARN